MDSLIAANARTLWMDDEWHSPCGVPGVLRRAAWPTASTITTAMAHSTTALRNVGERIVQSTMTMLLAATY